MKQVIIIRDEAEQILGLTGSGKSSPAELSKTAATDWKRLCADLRDCSVTLLDRAETISRLRQSGRFVLTTRDEGATPSTIVQQAHRLYAQRETVGARTIAVVLREAEIDELNPADRRLWTELSSGRAQRRGVSAIRLRIDQ